MNLSKRNFINMASNGALSMAFGRFRPLYTAQPGSQGWTLCLFSKHLSFMPWQELAETVKKLGLDGIDLTVRPGGHVLPDRALEDLPRAVSVIRKEGLSIPMITTALTTASDPTAQPILKTAGKLGIPYFKPGYYKYELIDVRRELEGFRANFTRLVELGKNCGVQCGFHNHEGNIGAPLWDVAKVIDQLDPQWVGYYFDIRHAVVEGGVGGWKIATNLVAQRLKMIAIKDFFWERSAKGWRVVNCPLGEGMVDWRQYFKLLKQANFRGPISLHLEYEIPGKTQSEKEANTIVAIKRDFEFLKAGLWEAYK
ncbi:MAG: TIM barrel protein [Acidobacteria bacterium]|nr:TIM barrel protein [Acidobacteriota bacterium]